MTEVEWNMVKVHMMELGISHEDINGLQKKLLKPTEVETTKHTTVEEYLRDTENHVLAELQYITDEQLLIIIQANNINPDHAEYLKIALEEY